MQILKYVFAVLLAATLVACGGGGGSAGTSTSSSGSTATTATATTSITATVAVTPASVELVASSNSLPSASGTVVVSALVKNGTNNGLAGQSISFSSTSGVLQGATSVTDVNGVATVNLVTGANRSNRVIQVTATAGGVVGTVSIPVIGTALSVSGVGSLLLGGVSIYSFLAVDSAGAPLLNASLSATSSKGNGLSSSSLTTDATGKASLIYTANLSGTDTLTVSGLGTSAQMQIFVSSEDFSFQSPSVGTQIVIGASQAVSVLYRIGGSPAAGRTVLFSTTRGTVSASTALTDAAGIATINVSSNTSGPATINASIAGVAQSSLPIEFLATTPATLVLQANPNAVLPNSAGSTSNSAALLATVRDSSGNPVKNVAVSFSATDPSGGAISPGSGTTDANGNVSVSFIPGATSTANNGVSLTAQLVTNASIFGTATLTVSGRALFITIGTGNEIGNLNVSTYQKPFTVYVTDANGAAVANQSVVLSVYSTLYLKGRLIFPTGGSSWSFDPASPPTSCANEDLNADGFLDTTPANEDTNGNGSLTPGGVVVVSPGTVTTDINGFANFNLLYGEQYAPWIVARIRASATVAGTESSSAVSHGLSGVASDFTSESVPPAGRFSPFGQSTSCTDAF